MQKVLDFLERYVQWVAVGLAALFLGYALYSYMPMVTQPVALELGGETLSPGGVDPKIREVADALQTRVEGTQTIPVRIPPFRERWLTELATKPKTLALPPTLLAAQRVEYPKDINWNRDPRREGPNNKVNALPTLPVAILEPAATTGFAQVSVAPAGQPAVPAAAPGAPVAGGVYSDTTWVRTPFTISAASLAKAFRDVNLPQNWSATTFLRVEVLRQKQLPGGTWSAEEVVPPLPTIQLLPMPGTGSAALVQQTQYLQWATANQTPIVQPEFFPVVAGADPRYGDAAADGAPAPPAAAFNPETFPAAGEPGGDISTLTPEQQQQVRAVRQRRAREAEQNTPRTPPGGGGGRRGGGGGPGGPGGFRHDGTSGEPPVLPPALGSTPFFQPRGAGVTAGAPGAVPPPYPVPPMDGMGAPQAAGPALLPVTPLPAAPFQPASVPNGVIEGWAYDVTATAGSTYRYRIRYQIQNPIFGANNVASDPALPQVFALTGEDAQQWSTPITIAPLTHVYLAQLPQIGGTRIGFTVFRWQAGKRQRTTALVGPGDSIGKVDGDVDFRTNWTLVEVRRDSSANNQYALIMNADGVLKKLDYDADSRTEAFRTLNAEVDAAAAAPPAGGPPPGGGAPGAPPFPPR